MKTTFWLVIQGYDQDALDEETALRRGLRKIELASADIVTAKHEAKLVWLRQCAPERYTAPNGMRYPRSPKIIIALEPDWEQDYAVTYEAAAIPADDRTRQELELRQRLEQENHWRHQQGIRQLAVVIKDEYHRVYYSPTNSMQGRLEQCVFDGPVTEIAGDFPMFVRDQAFALPNIVRSYLLVGFDDYVSSEEARASIERAELTCATVEELLDFGAQYKGAECQAPIAALGTNIVRDGLVFYPYLHTTDGRNRGFFVNATNWQANTTFLCRKK